MVMPTELSTTNKTPRTNDKVQRNLLHDYEQNFANPPDHLQLVKLCPNVGITKTAARRQYFTTVEDAELDKLGAHFTSRQRSIQSNRMDPWEHEDRSSFGGGSSVTIKAVTESRSRSHPSLVMELVPG